MARLDVQKGMVVTGVEIDDVPLGELAYRRIRADIVACRLAPGQRLTERGLAAELGLGVSPVRDALTRLDHEGLVRTIPRKGYQVAPLTIKSVDALFEFWALIGPELARRGAIAASDEQLAEAVVTLRELAAITDSGTATGVTTLRGVELAGHLFDILAEAADNEYMQAVHHRLSGEVLRIWTLVLGSKMPETGRRATVLEDAVDALARRDADVVAEIARQDIELSHDRVLRTLARWPSVINSEVVPFPSR
ncbi:GntR family transcriptional regulator [Nocardia nova]|uniref:GntR family transcriptional regulator n=1 Tax=Nocardia nova TaxID=37330 RepID=UPI0037ACFAFF